jgi:hypothetical protein
MRLSVQINNLLLQHRVLFNRRQMLATLLSPVHRLPPELLGEIFRYCLPCDFDEKGAHNAVMLPSHVCRHWRGVALSTPTLWTNIVLRVTNGTFESRAALVTTWFSRSGGSPLSFTLVGRENVRPILAFLLRYCNRWQHISLHVPFETLPCLEAAKGHFQHLETMRIYAYTHSDMSYSFDHIFKSVPRLREVSLGCQLIWNNLSHSCAQLTELDAGYASYAVGDCLSLLQSMRNLQKLRIRMDRGVVEGHRHFALSHPLVSLRVRGRGMLFDHITLPNLRDLDVGEIDSEWPQSQFISFLERSSPPLQSFSFGVPAEDGVVWDDNMVQILLHTPSLHSLCLVYTWCGVGGGSFLERLSPQILDNGQINCLIPKLDTISIRLGCQLDAPDYRALRDMVESRCSLAHNTNARDNLPGPIERIQRVSVECSQYGYFGSVEDTTWYEEVSEIVAPLEEVVDTVQITIS